MATTRHATRLAVALILLAGSVAAAEPLIPLQPLIDATPPGGTLVLAPGRYQGPAVIHRTMTLDGGRQATLDGGGHGSVLAVEGDGITVQNLKLVNSGGLHDEIDAGVRVRGRHNIIKDNVVEDCLFGIELARSDGNVIRRNLIRARTDDIGRRGDGIRLWYSMDNAVQDNRVEGARDTIIWYSERNRLTGNSLIGGRYGFHFMLAKNNMVRDNIFQDNTVGIFLMYADDIDIRHNRIIASQGPAGIGIGLKESSGTIIRDNAILANATGIYFDVSPYDTENPITVEGNHIAFNGVAMLFHNDWEGVRARTNDFIGNFTAVAVQGGGSARRNEWRGNYWDTYQGFDRDGDGVGDVPFEAFDYADRLWMDVPDARFFRGSPVLELIDFMERLAPFSEPRLILSDPAPRLRPVAAAPAP